MDSLEIFFGGAVHMTVNIGSALLSILAVYLLSRMNMQLAGEFRAANRYMASGLLMNAAAMLLSAFFGNSIFINGIEIDVRGLLVAAGMIFVLVSIHKLSKLVLPRTST